MIKSEIWHVAGELTLLFAFAVIISIGLIILLRPILTHYTLVRPNVRSSHREPTPQGGGIAVIGATAFVVASAIFFSPDQLSDPLQLAIVLSSVIGLSVVGATDDIRPLEALPRLLLQAAAVVAVVATLPAELRIIPVVPWWLERACILVGGLWFVNLVNFMDGIDWMTVAEVVPLTTALSAFGLMGALPWEATLVAIALCGAIIGFAPFNRPIARLFLGDVGSLPIGLLLGWLLILLAGSGYLAAAILLPLYYLADATITLLRRLVKAEQILQAHRSHFYQRATDHGFSVYQIVGRVVAVNILLVGLAVITLVSSSTSLHVTALALGIVIVSALLWNFSCAKQ